MLGSSSPSYPGLWILRSQAASARGLQHYNSLTRVVWGLEPSDFFYSSHDAHLNTYICALLLRLTGISNCPLNIWNFSIKAKRYIALCESFIQKLLNCSISALLNTCIERLLPSIFTSNRTTCCDWLSNLDGGHKKLLKKLALNYVFLELKRFTKNGLYFAFLFGTILFLV